MGQGLKNLHGLQLLSAVRAGLRQLPSFDLSGGHDHTCARFLQSCGIPTHIQPARYLDTGEEYWIVSVGRTPQDLERHEEER